MVHWKKMVLENLMTLTQKRYKGIREMGVSHVWYTGVIEHALLTDYTSYGIPLDDADVVKGRAGSPYAIKDYYDVDPDLAVRISSRMKEFEQLVSRTHAEGLKVIIDFVPNHVARNYKSDAKPAGVKDLGESDDKSVAFSPKNNFYYLPGQSFQVPRGYESLGRNNTFPTKDGKFEETPAKATGNDQFDASPKITDWFETIKLNYGVDIQNGRKKFFDPDSGHMGKNERHPSVLGWQKCGWFPLRYGRNGARRILELGNPANQSRKSLNNFHCRNL